MRAAPLLLILVAATAAEAQQQGSVQLSTDTQILSGDPQRRGQEHPFEPDFGMLWTQPATRFGQFQMELRASRRGDDIHLELPISLAEAVLGSKLQAPTPTGPVTCCWSSPTSPATPSAGTGSSPRWPRSSGRSSGTSSSSRRGSATVSR